MRLDNSSYKSMMETVSTVRNLVTLGKEIKEYFDNRKETKSYRLSLREGDSAYRTAHKWLLSLIPEEDARRVTVSTMKDGLSIVYDSKEEQIVDLDGHRIKVFMEIPEPKVNADGGLRTSDIIGRAIVFECQDLDGVNAVKNLLVRLYDESRYTPAQLHVPSSWDNWQSRGPANKRSLDSIVLARGIKEMMIEDIEQFLRSEQKYTELGIPYHRGYLLYGPPGGGKTSIARAMASRLGGDVYAINLNSVKGNNELNSMIADINVPLGTCAGLVLEDIDVVSATQNRADSDGESGGVTLDGLLNVLDGMFTPDGLVFFMTTNDMSGFDKALIRPGRADMIIEIDYLDDDQFRRLCDHFMSSSDGLPPVDRAMKISPADIVGIFKMHLDSPRNSYDEVMKFVLERQYQSV